MEIAQQIYKDESGWTQIKSTPGFNSAPCDLVLAFGSKEKLGAKKALKELSEQYPKAQVISCSTAGEISGISVIDETIVATAISFDKTKIKPALVNYEDVANSEEAGITIARKLQDESLKHVLIISDGQMVNGSELVKGTNSVLPTKIPVTGGLAGDGTDFEGTLVGLNEDVRQGNIVGIGFYGNEIKIGFGSHGGWDEFGPHRKVTKSKGNILYEVDDQNALELYKKYLGPKAEELPGSALLFPLSMRVTDESPSLVRTILSVDEKEQSMTFAGDVPEGATVRFMKSNFDRLIDGASKAASDGYYFNEQPVNPELVLLISCVGRKVVLDQRIEEEIEAVEEIFGNETFYCGFYSYGELAPSSVGTTCDLHNQTMTLTTYSEK
ncbi:MAG: FIST C-terminal domain-containing protein [bacterium]|nr:FIST C-terminal domain-containing protein [bacterium]